MHLEWTKDATVLLNGREVARIDKEFWAERARAVIQGRAWELGKDRSQRTGTPQGQSEPAFRAWRPSALGRAWRMSSATATYEIRGAGFWSSGLVVLANGTQVGASGRTGFWSSRPTLDIADGVPVDDAVFLLWIAYLIRARDSAATASSP
ncbi:hypothetical protein Bcav_3895 [Beutenbergia cavernae DSM 12333]|uniref:Uncharacterized protein n=1 Tax=Beutenbergia cavernae (strain ATCC BAA-8 / DSM 12333 / CCUG 43141 / JCM 11478 / NBRC 16432 / NCIMB 13614 / HKI 0122) TaxID=471853 RepID=C5C4L3_BEUC1|nr:hypothetical protein [Beutenbergia cavernae]ACQ82137.1 hypothetical protein Bcav_3895 [Beutenbergia cavernae DSM 12333]